MVSGIPFAGGALMFSIGLTLFSANTLFWLYGSYGLVGLSVGFIFFGVMLMVMADSRRTDVENLPVEPKP